MTHYNKSYFKWQTPIGEFGGWAIKDKFDKHILKSDVVLDFGCAGGWLLDEIDCKGKIGVDINDTSIQLAKQRGIITYKYTKDVPDGIADKIISSHALEHTFRPLDELKELYKKLKVGGKIIFVVPSESVRNQYTAGNINQHLYTWSPMNMGNLFNEAGFEVNSVKPYIHKWIPRYYKQSSMFGRGIFNFISNVYGRLYRNASQVYIVASKTKQDAKGSKGVQDE